MNEAKAIAQSYFNAWRARDFDALHALLDPNVSFLGPLGQYSMVSAI